MARGEVALIVTATAMNPELGTHALPAQFMIMTVLLILVSSILTPILLKVLYNKEPKSTGGDGTNGQELPVANAEQAEEPAPSAITDNSVSIGE